MIQYAILLFYVFFGIVTYFAYKGFIQGMPLMPMLPIWFFLLLLSLLALFKIWKLNGRKVMLLHLAFLITVMVVSVTYTINELQPDFERRYINNESDTIR